MTKSPIIKFSYILVVLLISFLPGRTDSRIWYVLPDSSGDAPTIAAAVDSCSTGDTVFLANGIYVETGIILNKNISIVGESISAIIDGDSVGVIFSVWDSISAENLTIRYADKGFMQRYGLDVGWALSDIVAYGFRQTAIGVDFPFGRHGTLYISNCTISSSGGGISANDADAIYVNNCIVTDCSAGFSRHEANTFQVWCSDCWNNTVCDKTQYPGEPRVEFLHGNFSQDPLFCDPENKDFTLASASPCLDAFGCDLVGALGYGCLNPTGIAQDVYNAGKIPVLISYPNPFNPYTTIEFGTSEAGNVRLEVYDVRGRLVCTLLNRYEPAGKYYLEWNGRNESGVKVSSGVYFVKLEYAGQRHTRKIVMLK